MEDIDPEQNATYKHFRRLRETYGAPVICLNLVKQNAKSSEFSLHEKFEQFGAECKELRNDFDFVDLISYDFHHYYAENEEIILKDIGEIGTNSLKRTNLFCFDSRSGIVSKQKGVMRVNCIDCLDRTNNSMACIGSVVIVEMLGRIGIELHTQYYEKKAAKNQLLWLIFELFGFNGDCIAQQYAGSDAFHKAQVYKTSQGEYRSYKQNIAFIAVKRYFSNLVLDYEKQKAYWLFLGDFLPFFQSKDKPALWDADVYKENLKMLRIDKENLEINRNEKLSWWHGTYFLRTLSWQESHVHKQENFSKMVENEAYKHHYFKLSTILPPVLEKGTSELKSRNVLEDSGTKRKGSKEQNEASLASKRKEQERNTKQKEEEKAREIENNKAKETEFSIEDFKEDELRALQSDDFFLSFIKKEF